MLRWNTTGVIHGVMVVKGDPVTAGDLANDKIKLYIDRHPEAVIKDETEIKLDKRGDK